MVRQNRARYTSPLLYDEPNDHELACHWLKTFFESLPKIFNGIAEIGSQRYIVKRNWKHMFPPEFVIKHQLHKTRDHFEHSFDATLFYYDDSLNPLAFFEVGQVCDTSVVLADGNRIKIYKSRHGTKHQQENDGVIQDFVDTYYKGVPLYRPEKSDCLDYGYLTREYAKYI
jgi:hypothetical protein